MKYVFDWEAFGGCLGTLIVLALIPTGAFIVYFLVNTLLFLLPALLAITVILGITYAIGCVFKEMFFKKVE